MFRKVILFLLILSPLFFLFVGYPITSQKQKIYGGAVSTQRCFAIGNTREFFSCLKNNKRVSGAVLMTQVVKDTNDLQPNMGYLLVVAFICQTCILFSFVGKKERMAKNTL